MKKRIIASVIALAVISAIIIGLNINNKENYTPNREVNQSVVEGSLLSMDCEYIPDIDYLYNDTLIFTTSRGTIIYDLKADKVKSTIDLQKIGCADFNENTKQTCILKDSDNLVVFNIKAKSDLCFDNLTPVADGIPYGSYYIFDLTSNDSELTYTEKDDSQEKLSEYYEAWKKHRNQYINTFEIADKDYIDYDSMGQSYKKYEEIFDNYYYSNYSIPWAKDNKVYNSFIIKSDDEYCLVNKDDKNFSFHPLNLGKAENKLPKYKYSEDEKIKAIEKYEIKDFYNQYYGEEYKDAIIIPTVVDCGQIKDGEFTKVFAYVIVSTNYEVGNTIFSDLFDNNAICYYLKENGKEYTVEKVEKSYSPATEEIMEEIDEMTGWHLTIGSRLKHFLDNHSEEDKYIKRNLKNYVVSNNLPIKYYKDYGQDKKELFS